MYKRQGYGVPKDLQEAIRLFRLAAGQGYDTAQNNLGAMYENGDGVAQDWAEAIRLFEVAAYNGCAGAAAHLGDMYEHGIGVARDERAAEGWYDFAIVQARYARTHNDLSMKRLAELFNTLKTKLNDVDMQRCKGIKLPLTP